MVALLSSKLMYSLDDNLSTRTVENIKRLELVEERKPYFEGACNYTTY